MNQEPGADGQRPGDGTDGAPPDTSWGWRRPADPSSARPGQVAQPAATGSFDEPGRAVRPTRPYDDYGTGYPTGGSGGFGAALGQDDGGQPPPDGYGGTFPAPPPWWRRRPPRLALILGAFAMVLILLFVIVDRIAVSVAESEMAKQLRTSVTQGLACGTTPPTVRNISIGGFPFLTQILFGKFTNIGVTVENVPTPGPRIAWVHANLKGVHVPLHQILTNSVGAVRVDKVQATVRVRYDDLNTFLAGQPGDVRVNPTDGGRRLEITGTADVPILGPQQVGGVTTFEIHDNQLTLVPTEITLRGALNLSIPLGGLGQLLPSIALPVGQLPFRLTVDQASTDASGLALTATAADVVLPKAAPPTPCPPGKG